MHVTLRSSRAIDEKDPQGSAIDATQQQRTQEREFHSFVLRSKEQRLFFGARQTMLGSRCCVTNGRLKGHWYLESYR